MGTNYYMRTDRGTKVHIGKKSCGWQFLWSAHNRLRKGEDEKLFTYSKKNWLSYLDDNNISDEYQKPILYKEFLAIIKGSPEDKKQIEDTEWLDAEGCPFVTKWFI